MLQLAHREPLPALAEALSRQAACLRLPPPSISPESQPGAPAPRRFSGWGSSRPLSGFTPSSQPGLPDPVFFSWTGFHRLLSPSFSSGSLPLPLVESPSLSSVTFLSRGSQPPLFLFLAGGPTSSVPSCVLRYSLSPSLLFPGLEFQTF